MKDEKPIYQYKVIRKFTVAGRTYEWGTQLTHTEYLNIPKEFRDNIQELKSPA